MNSRRSVARTAACLLLAAAARAASAAEPYTEHTYRLSGDESSPPAAAEAAAFLAGTWTGTAFGQRFEETWNAPSAGTMVGLFKLFDGDEVSLYEIQLIAVVDGALTLQVKHFNADFSAWEDKGESVDFALVRVGESELHFEGLSFYRRGEDRMDVYLVTTGTGGVSEQHLVYERNNGQ